MNETGWNVGNWLRALNTSRIKRRKIIVKWVTGSLSVSVGSSKGGYSLSELWAEVSVNSADVTNEMWMELHHFCRGGEKGRIHWKPCQSLSTLGMGWGGLISKWQPLVRAVDSAAAVLSISASHRGQGEGAGRGAGSVMWPDIFHFTLLWVEGEKSVGCRE